MVQKIAGKNETPLVQGWHSDWERNVYAQGRHLNRYPHHAVVGYLHRRYGAVPNRSLVRILEVGCGAGNNIWCIAREGFTVAGIDGSASAIRHASDRFASEGLSGDLRVGDFAHLPWADASFDMVLDRSALTCAARPTIEAALDEVRRVLKPGGSFFSIIYSDRHPDRRFGASLGGGAFHRFTDGYFVGLGTAFFCSRGDIDALFGARFRMTALVHTSEEDALAGRVLNTHWRVECEKSA